MTLVKIRTAFVLGAVVGVAASSYAQQTDAPAAPTSTAPAASAPAATAPAADAPKGPSQETIKKAKAAGYRAKLRKGVTLFCKEDTPIGSHFPEEKCVDENQLLFVLDREQAQRDQMSQHACGNGACGGK